MSHQVLEQQHPVWTAGQVAKLVGLSPVTLRSWAARYGVGPSRHARGSHRRYTEDDIDTLRTMVELIEAGTPTADAARISLRGRRPFPATPAGLFDEIAAAAELLDQAGLRGLLEHSLRNHGASITWTEVVAPLLRDYGDRWMRDGDCIDLENQLVDTFAGALYATGPERLGDGRPVLLSCCPGERHTLPLEVLRSVLISGGIPALVLTGGVPAPTTTRAAERVDARAVLLWSLVRETADLDLARRLKEQGLAVGFAGPGWPPAVRRRKLWSNDLAAAVAGLSHVP